MTLLSCACRAVRCCEQNGQSTGILAAAIGLYHQVSARISRSSDHSTGSEVGKQGTSTSSVRVAFKVDCTGKLQCCYMSAVLLPDAVHMSWSFSFLEVI